MIYKAAVIFPFSSINHGVCNANAVWDSSLLGCGVSCVSGYRHFKNVVTVSVGISRLSFTA